MVVLVVTHHKTSEDILALFDFLHIETDAIFSNQNEKRGHYELEKNGHHIDVFEFDDVGVSKNRNHVLDLAPDGLCLCVDDDCVLEKGYEETVSSFFKQRLCEVALFNGRVPYEGNRLVHDKKTARVRRFKDVSYAGGPGLAFLGSALKKSSLRYDERLGYPNELYIGEDSLFLKNLAASPLCFYRSETPIFTVAIDKEDNSIYFQGYDDKFFFVKGALAKILYPSRHFFYPLYVAFAVAKKSKTPFLRVYKKMKEGRKAGREFLK
ncbi:MAG: hypothetical protein K6E59_04540 [Bacilli bacterium]|nr:hypothetical protein [Bacilli bacterium]